MIIKKLRRNCDAETFVPGAATTDTRANPFEANVLIQEGNRKANKEDPL